MHPLHDVALPADIGAFVPVIIEIPKGSRCTYDRDRRAAVS
jgi:inorganic pyrophosphatase